MKYKLYLHGWELNMSAHQLTEDEVSRIEELIEDGEYDDVTDIGFDLEYDILPDYAVFDTNMWYISSKASNSSDTAFFLVDENGNDVSKWHLSDIMDSYEMLGDEDGLGEYEGFNGGHTIAGEDIPHILTYLEENKGYICFFEIESDEVPTAKDFCFIAGSIETKDGDIDFVDKVCFKKTVLEPNYDESSLNGKNLEFKIISYEE
jgi:hypothetical protein